MPNNIKPICKRDLNKLLATLSKDKNNPGVKKIMEDIKCLRDGKQS